MKTEKQKNEQKKNKASALGNRLLSNKSLLSNNLGFAIREIKVYYQIIVRLGNCLMWFTID